MKLAVDVTILLPVYNEKDSLELLLVEIEAFLEPSGKTYEVLFVDDGSTDGSLEILEKLKI